MFARKLILSFSIVIPFISFQSNACIGLLNALAIVCQGDEVLYPDQKSSDDEAVQYLKKGRILGFDVANEIVLVSDPHLANRNYDVAWKDIFLPSGCLMDEEGAGDFVCVQRTKSMKGFLGRLYDVLVNDEVYGPIDDSRISNITGQPYQRNLTVEGINFSNNRLAVLRKAGGNGRHFSISFEKTTLVTPDCFMGLCVDNEVYARMQSDPTRKGKHFVRGINRATGDVTLQQRGRNIYFTRNLGDENHGIYGVNGVLMLGKEPTFHIWQDKTLSVLNSLDKEKILEEIKLLIE